MKSIDVLDGKIEEVRNGNDPCSTVKYNIKPNGIIDPKLTNGHKVLEDRDAVMSECGEKLLSTEISREDAKINKDGCHDPANSDKLSATVSPENQPNNSSSNCSNNGLPSGQDDPIHVSKEVEMSEMKEPANESTSNDQSETNQQILPSPMLDVPDTKKIDEKKGQESKPNTSNVSNSNVESEKKQEILVIPGNNKLGEKTDKEVESDILNALSEMIDEPPVKTNDEVATSKVENHLGLGVDKIQESKYDDFVNSTSKIENKSTLKPAVEVEAATVLSDHHQGKEVITHKSDGKDCEKSIIENDDVVSKTDDSEEEKIEAPGDKISLEDVSEPFERSGKGLKVGESKDEKIEVSGVKTPPNAVSEIIDKTILKPDDSKETKIEASEDKSLTEAVSEPIKKPIIETLTLSDLSEEEDYPPKKSSETLEQAISNIAKSEESRNEASGDKSSPKAVSESIKKPVETVKFSEEDLKERSLESVDKSIEVENGSSSKAGGKEASSVIDSISLEDEEVENALLQMDTPEEDVGKKVVEGEEKKTSELKSDVIELEESDVVELKEIDKLEAKKSDVIELEVSDDVESNKSDVIVIKEGDKIESEKSDVIELKESDEIESKKIDEQTSKSDEVGAADKTEIEGQPIEETERIESQSINKDSESPDKTSTEEAAPMEVDDVEQSENGATELEAIKDSERELQGNERSAVGASDEIDTPRLTDKIEIDTLNKPDKIEIVEKPEEIEIDALKQPVKPSALSDAPTESSLEEVATLQVGQKRPAEFEDENSKRFKTDDNSTESEGSLKKRSSPSLEDIISESKRKKTELDGDKNSKFSVNSVSEKSTNIDNSDSDVEKNTKLDLDENCETDVDLDLELKSNSSESSVSDANEAKSVNKDELLKRLLNSDSDDSNKESNSSEGSSKVNFDSGSSASLSGKKPVEDGKSSSSVLIRETLRRLKKSDLEDLVMLKMSENTTYKSEIGELRTKYQTAKESIDRWMKRCQYFEKIEQELSILVKRYVDHIETYKCEKGPEFLTAPMKFTRSVGLQVTGIFPHKQSRPSNARSAHMPKTKQQEEHEQLMQQKYRQQQQLHEQVQKKQQQMHEQQKLQQLQLQKEQQQKALLEQESIQAVNNVKPSVPKVTTNVRSSTPRRMVSSKPASAAPSSLAQEVNTTSIVAASPTNQKSPTRSPAVAASSSTTTPASGPVPVAITAAKMSRTSPPSKSSLEVIDLTDKDDKSRASSQDTQKPTQTSSYTVVRQMVPGKSSTPKLPMGTKVVSAASRNNAVTLAANGTVVLKNGAVNNVIQRPVQAMRVTQSATHPAPLPPCPPAVHQSGWLLAPPRPQLVVRKTPNGAGIMLSWTLALNKTYEEIASYQLYAYQEGTAPPSSTLWKKVGDVKALPLPMACTLTQFVEGHKYHFAVRAVDIHSRVGHFSGPSTITLN